MKCYFCESQSTYTPNICKSCNVISYTKFVDIYSTDSIFMLYNDLIGIYHFKNNSLLCRGAWIPIKIDNPTLEQLRDKIQLYSVFI